MVVKYFKVQKQVRNVGLWLVSRIIRHHDYAANKFAATFAKSAFADWTATDAGRFCNGRRGFNRQPQVANN